MESSGISYIVSQVEAFKEMTEEVPEVVDPYTYREYLLQLLELYGWNVVEYKATTLDDGLEFRIEFHCDIALFTLNILQLEDKKIKRLKYIMNF